MFLAAGYAIGWALGGPTATHAWSWASEPSGEHWPRAEFVAGQRASDDPNVTVMIIVVTVVSMLILISLSKAPWPNVPPARLTEDLSLAPRRTIHAGYGNHEVEEQVALMTAPARVWEEAIAGTGTRRCPAGIATSTPRWPDPSRVVTHGAACLVVHCNMSDRSTVDAMFEQAVAEFGPVDVLVRQRRTSARFAGRTDAETAITPTSLPPCLQQSLGIVGRLSDDDWLSGGAPTSSACFIARGGLAHDEGPTTVWPHLYQHCLRVGPGRDQHAQSRLCGRRTGRGRPDPDHRV